MSLSSFLPHPSTVVKVAASAAGVVLASAGSALYLFQNRLIYPANLPEGSRKDVPMPDQYGLPFEDVEMTTPDGVKIKAFLMLYERDGVSASDRPTVLLLHANAGNVGHRLPVASVFVDKMKCNVLALSYRGYGHSDGSPSENGLKLDSQTALDYILSHPNLEKTPIFLYGQSIGGAVAVHLASQNSQRLKGLVIENTFRSLPDLIPTLMPYLKPFLPLLLHQIWPSSRSIATLPVDFPVLFLAGEKDEIVEPGQMKGLFNACSSEKKQWRSFRYGTHNDTCSQPFYFAYVARFITSVCDLPLPSAFDSAIPHLSSSSGSIVTSAPPTAPPTSDFATTLSQREHGFHDFPLGGNVRSAPAAPEAGNRRQSVHSSGEESYEVVEKEEETEGSRLESKDKQSAGSFGLKEEVEEVEKAVRKKLGEL